MDANKALLYLIIISNVLFSLKGFSDRYFFDKYKFQIGAINRGEKIRLLTSGFLHVDYLHLLLNMYVLYIFAPLLISEFGGIMFLVIYFGSLFAGNFFTLIFHKNQLYYSAVGASGAVAGVIFAAILLNPQMELLVFFFPMKGYIFGIVYLVYSIYGMKKQLGNIGHSTHLGGAIGGYGLALLFRPEIFLEDTLIVVLLGIPIVFLLLFGDKLAK